jgi:serine/threonine-protein kinase
MKASPAKTCPACGEHYGTDVLFCPRDGSPLANTRSPSFQTLDKDPYLGVELPGQIQLRHLIGVGSMGRVYRAFQAGIERDVAVKVLHRELSGNKELVTRFHREAKVASRLVHPNVVQVLMTGSLPFTNEPGVGGELYLVMEHLDGISLLSALCAAGTSGQSEALPLPRALHLTLQICDAVGEAHAQGIVHRDLKPENVMLVRRGEDHDYVKILDFGIARLDWLDGAIATQAGLIFGTAKYISPEGAEGQAVTPAADVYSIATILYQCLAGRTPFEGDSPVALLVQHTHAPAPELRSIVRASYVPPPIAEVIMKNLAKKPGDRAPNARVLGRELVAAARASGMFPEELSGGSSGVLSPHGMGPVKLVSKERTKSHELSADLASRIGGVAARAPGEPQTSTPTPPPPRDSGAPASHPPTARASVGPSGTMGGASSPPPSARESAESVEAIAPNATQTGATRSSAPLIAVAAPSPPSPPSKVPNPELDFDDERAQPATTSTMQGTETTLTGEPAPSRRRSRWIALAAAGAVTVALSVGLTRHFTAASGESADALLAEAREEMKNRAWDAPADHNVKATLARAAERYPGDGRVNELRQEAADRLVSDALGRKYAGDAAEALRLARLSLDLSPTNTTAQHLVAELSADRGPEIAPAPSAASSSSKPTKKPLMPLKPTSSASAGAPPSPNSAAVLPPSPPALPTDHVPPPPPSSTGPWL